MSAGVQDVQRACCEYSILEATRYSSIGQMARTVRLQITYQQARRDQEVNVLPPYTPKPFCTACVPAALLRLRAALDKDDRIFCVTAAFMCRNIRTIATRTVSHGHKVCNCLQLTHVHVQHQGHCHAFPTQPTSGSAWHATFPNTKIRGTRSTATA